MEGRKRVLRIGGIAGLLAVVLLLLVFVIVAVAPPPAICGEEWLSGFWIVQGRLCAY